MPHLSDRQLDDLVAKHGICRTAADPDDWFPDANDELPHAGCKARTDAPCPICEATARRLCGPCPVQTECLALAFRVERMPFGVWGGKTAAERRAMLREHRRQPAGSAA
jgi:hypothetical protein